jgi:hypothetical protein
VYVNPAAARHGRRDARQHPLVRAPHPVRAAGICIYSADIETRKRPQPFGHRIRQLFR